MLKNDGFYDYAWSPVEGCLHGCEYCYARKKLKGTKNGFEPTFYEDRLTQPMRVKPCKIFASYYTDLMGDFINREWVEKIIRCLYQTAKAYIYFHHKESG